MATNKLIARLVKEIDENNGIVLFSKKEVFKEDSVWCHTGCPELDFNLGTLGFPIGFTEIAGKSLSGKTTLGLAGIKSFQQSFPEGVSLIMSSEKRDNKNYAKKMGVDVDNVIIISSHYVEDLFYKLRLEIDKINKAWKELKLEGKPKIFILWDSIGATLSRAEYETQEENMKILEKNMDNDTKKELKHAQMAAFAKNSKGLVKGILGKLYDDEIVMVGINHTGVDFQSGQRKSFGGEWVEYLPTLRLETILIEKIKLTQKDHTGKDIEVEVGQKTKIKVVKNDFGSRKPTIMEIFLGWGIVLNEADISYAIDKGLLKKEGVKKLSFMNDKLKWSTKREFYNNYEEKNKFIPLLHKKIQQERHKDVIKSKKID